MNLSLISQKGAVIKKEVVVGDDSFKYYIMFLIIIVHLDMSGLKKTYSKKEVLSTLIVY